MKRRDSLALFLAPLLILEGCQTSREITRRSELMDPVRPEEITVRTKSDTSYQLSFYSLADSTLRGAGTVKDSWHEDAFNGVIPLGSIRGIEVESPHLLGSLAALGATALFIAVLQNNVNRAGHGLAVKRDIERYYPPGGESSCPYVYAWNGDRYVLEAEPFGTALGKAMEMTSSHLLPSARQECGTVRLRLTNERRETHYVNSIRLLAIDAGTSPGVVLDGSGAAWPVAHPRAPVTASEKSGRSILEDLASIDGRMWECDASSLTSGSSYADVLDLVFTRPPASTSGSLILTGINTTLSTAMFGYCCRIAGGDGNALTKAIDTDPGLIALIEAYREDASMKVSVWNGSEWEAQGAFLPEANAVTFSRGLRIRVPDDAGDTVRVRLRSMADVWKIDAISADWTPAAPLPMREMELLSAIGPGGEDLRPTLGADDDRFEVLFPPDRVELIFSGAETPPGERVVYAVAGRGYLHEWIPAQTGDGVASLAAMVPEERRIDFLKELLKHREIVFRSAYEEWVKVRTGGCAGATR